jgi:hypothetical protein
MFVAIEDVVDEAVYDRGLSHCLIAQKDYLVLEQGRDGALGEVEVADVCHRISNKNQASGE